MCDKEKYECLDERVDELENRMTAVETAVQSMRVECRNGFTDLKQELVRIYSERAEWSKWARDNLGVALRWVGYIVLLACGINQLGGIVKGFSKQLGF